MTKIYYIYLFIIVFLISCSGKKFEIPTDNLEDIIINKSVKEKDTIYFYFDYSENLKKDRVQTDPIKKDTFMNYRYYESRNNIYGSKRNISIFYRTHTYRNSEKIADIKVISKRFLRKNKDIIIFPKDLEGNNMYKYAAKEFTSDKVYYIIDTAEKKGNKFIAKEVRYSFGTFLEI
jgi:hypothetical protein